MIVKTDVESGGIVWLLGEPSGWGALSEKCLRPVNLTRWPYHGHNPRLTSERTIVFFDNGTMGARAPSPVVPTHRNYSRGVEYRVDEAGMTVEEVRASDIELSPSSWLCPDMGDAHKLPVTGNMMVVWAHCVRKIPGQVFGHLDYSGTLFNEHHMHSRLREFTRDENPRMALDLLLSDRAEELGWRMYGCRRIPGFYCRRNGQVQPAERPRMADAPRTWPELA